MTSRSPSRSRVRPLSSTALPAPPPPPEQSSLRRKYSLDHGEGADDGWRRPAHITGQDDEAEADIPQEMTPAQTEVPAGVSNMSGEETDINHNGPSDTVITDPRECKRKVLKKQTSFESIGCDDNYFYDFFDRNCRPPTPGQTTSSEPIPHTTPPNAEEAIKDIDNIENNNSQQETSRLENNSGASSKLRRNVNDGRVRPRSWLTTTSTGKVEDPKRVRRRKTDPCGKDFLSNYERALSSLLYQPYECRTESPSMSTNLDDSDVGYWLGQNPKRWKEREQSVGECCSYQNESTDSSSRSSLSSSSSSTAEYMRRKPWGDCKDPSSSSIRALLSDWRAGNVAKSSDLDAGLAREPPGALATGWSSAGRSQSSARHGREMLVSVTEPETRGSQSDLLGSAARSASEDPVSVSCYRAVPATVSAVPVIPCNNVSNVRIVQTTRTFTSTEAQTDDVIVDAIRAAPGAGPSREQRRRERRERRHQRRLLHPHTHTHPHQTVTEPVWHTPPPPPGSLAEPLVDRLPDILNSHLPPPYSTLAPPPLPPPMAVPVPVPGSPPPQPAALRFPFAIVPAGRRRSRLSPHFTAEDEPKSCCGVSVSQTISIRWFIILIFLVGLCCAVVGTVLGAMKATGREHLTVSLLMIGVGIVLVAVSGVAWRLTAQDAPSCRAMLGLGGDDTGGEPNRRFVPRLPPSYGRPHHPYAAMMYPEFQYRAPPPSYQASMQEYRLRLLLLDRQSSGNTVSPPPTYRSHPPSLLRAPLGFRGRETVTPSQSEYSRPPSYRSRTSSRPDPSHSHSHSREPSGQGSDPGQAVNVIAVHPHIIKLAPSPPLPSKSSSGDKDSNLVTIVQTTSEPQGPVIVTISGQDAGASHCHQTEMEILAHL